MTLITDDYFVAAKETDEQPIARRYFSNIRSALDRKIADTLAERKSKKKDWRSTVATAQSDLDAWQTASGREQNYTSHQLAEARVAKEIMNAYEKEHRGYLLERNACHQAIIATDIIEGGLAERMMAEGKEGRKLSVLEISSRLAPVLTFPGSSRYFEMAALPYGTNARKVLGEAALPHYVSLTAAEASARNMQEKFGTHYVLAETSAAPRGDVPKSRRSAELYVCSLVGPEAQQFTVQFPGVHLRAEFDARVREVMYQQLQKMYAVK